MSSARRETLFRWLIPAAAVGVAGAFYLAMANPEFRFMEGASAIKLLWARAILSGQGFIEIGRTGTPPEIVRPPGFALFVSAVVWLFGEDMLALKFLNNLFAPLGCLFFYFLCLRVTGKRWFAGISAAAGWLFPDLYFHAAFLEAEMMFMFLVFLCLLFLERAREERFAGSANLAGFCVFMALAVLVRSAGLVLVPAGLCVLFFSRAERGIKVKWGLAIVLTWLVVGGGWMLRNQLVAPPGELTYVDKLLSGEPIDSLWWLAEDHRVPLLPPPKRADLTDLIMRIPLNGKYFIDQMASNLWTGFGARPVVSYFVSVPLLLLAGAGLIVGLKRRRESTAFFTLFYLPMILLWPYQDKRFLLPIAPVIILYLFTGAEEVISIVLRKLKREEFAGLPKHAVLILGLAVLAAYVVSDVALVRHGKDKGAIPTIKRSKHFIITSPNPGAYRTLTLFEWVRENTDKDAKVMYHSYSPCALITERQCSAIPMSDPDNMIKFIDDSDISIVVVDDEYFFGARFMAGFTPAFLLPAMEAHPERFEPVYRLEDSSYAGVYRITRPH